MRIGVSVCVTHVTNGWLTVLHTSYHYNYSLNDKARGSSIIVNDAPGMQYVVARRCCVCATDIAQWSVPHRTPANHGCCAQPIYYVLIKHKVFESFIKFDRRGLCEPGVSL